MTALLYCRVHSDIAKIIRDIANKALQLHCLNHNINLVLQEASSTTNLVSGALSTVQQLCVIIKGLLYIKNYRVVTETLHQ